MTDLCACVRACLQESKVLKFLGFMWNPLSWVMEAAAIMAIALANGGVSADSRSSCLVGTCGFGGFDESFS